MSHTKAFILSIVSCILLFSMELHGQNEATLLSRDSLRIDDVIKEVLKHNNLAISARYMEKAAYEKAKQAGAWDDPMLMAGVANLPTSFDFKEDGMTMRMIGLSQNIPYAGQKGLQSKAATSEAEASKEERKGVERDLALTAKLAYLDLYFRQMILKDLQSQYQLLQEIVNTAISKLKTDQATQAEVSTAQANLWRMDTEILSAQQEIEAARNDLLSLMDEEIAVKLPPLEEPKFLDLPSTVESWYNSAGEHYPPILKLRRASVGYAFQAASARRMRWPMLDLSASYGFRSDTPMEKRMDMINFQLTMSLPIFSGHQQNKMALSMDAMQQGVDAEANQIWRDTKANLRTLYSRAQRLLQSKQIYLERVIPADQDAINSALTGYAADRVPLSDLLDYAANVYRDRVNLNQISLELARTFAEVDKYTVDLEGPDYKPNPSETKE